MIVEVAYALPGRQRLVRLELAEGSTVRDAIESSGVLEEFAEIDLSANKVGIFGKRVDLATPVQDRDRVEIYRPLAQDAKELRRARAARAAKRSAA